jgi:type I restriction enzyme S subunit
MSATLPKGWAETSFEKVLISISNGISDKQNKERKGIPVTRIETISDGNLNLKKIGYVDDFPVDKLEKYALANGDILFSHINSPVHLGKTAIIRNLNARLYHGTNLLLLRTPKFSSLPSFFEFYCKYYRTLGEFSKNAQHAVNQSSLNQSKIKSFLIPLPPINEQKRIVTKLDKIVPRIESVKARLDTVPMIIKRFRQSVLTAAVTGKLTEKWREEHPEVEKISPNHDGINNNYGDYPETWANLLFGNVINELRNGISKKPNINPPGTKILRISANRSGYVNLMDYRFLPDGTGNYIQYVLKDGDLLFTRYNGNIDLVGVCGQVRNVKNNFLYPDKLMRVRLNEDFCCKSYIEYLFQTSEIREYIVSKSKTSAGQNGLSGKDLKLTPITLPPLEEQVEIVRQVDQLFALADKLNAHYQKAKTHVDKLSQSVLAKAFRGELVPQDPNDEPAEKLLERIMEEKARLSQRSQRTRRNKK